ncbi:MAG: hypothetical protein H0W02_13895 [Ktedonobacteraceae bacterium]|nr:hypothetical protein [Ktedonobacteraceae bacterium]
MQHVEVHSRSLQTTSQEPGLPTIVLDFLHEEITVAELIRRTVEEQVRELQAARKLNAGEARRILNRQYLTQEEMDEQAASGMVSLPLGTQAGEPDIAIADEVRRACRAFKKQAYLIIADGRRMTALDEKILFRPGSSVTFIRLIPLIGG